MSGKSLPTKPQRTCVACRKVTDQGALVRLVASGGELVADERRSQPGRGVYLHPGTPACGHNKQLAAALERTLRCRLTTTSVAKVFDQVASMPPTSMSLRRPTKAISLSSNQGKPPTTP